MKKYFIITRFRAGYTDEEAVEAIDTFPQRIEPKSHGCYLHVYGPFNSKEECDDFFWRKADTDDSAYGTYYDDTETHLYYEYFETRNPRIIGVSSSDSGLRSPKPSTEV